MPALQDTIQRIDQASDMPLYCVRRFLVRFWAEVWLLGSVRVSNTTREKFKENANLDSIRNQRAARQDKAKAQPAEEKEPPAPPK